jgi:hypothetical protein
MLKYRHDEQQSIEYYCVRARVACTIIRTDGRTTAARSGKRVQRFLRKIFYESTTRRDV